MVAAALGTIGPIIGSSEAGLGAPRSLLPLRLAGAAAADLHCRPARMLAGPLTVEMANDTAGQPKRTSLTALPSHLEDCGRSVLQGIEGDEGPV
jgi:hypothetical protein